jgi:hypothetical protein
MEFTGVELAAPVGKAVTDLARAVTAPVEKAAADGRRGGDGGRQAATAGRRHDEDRGRRAPALECGGDAGRRHSDVMENVETARRSAVTAMRNESAGKDTTVGLGRWTGGQKCPDNQRPSAQHSRTILLKKST